MVGIPIDSIEERMRLYLLGISEESESVRRLLSEQSRDKIDKLRRGCWEETVELGFFAQYVEERLFACEAFEGGRATHEIEQEDTQRPPINCKIVASPPQNLGGHVLLGTNKREGSARARI